MPSYSAPAHRIIGLFPALLGVGGVQQAGRLTALALSEIAHRHDWEADFFSLNDPCGPQTLRMDGREVPFRGFVRAKFPFVFAGIARARRSPKQGASVVLAAHPHLALPAAWIQLTAPHFEIVVMSHGIEVWNPLPLFRRRALLRSHRVLAPSRSTAQKLREVQGIPSEKISRLPWPLSLDFLSMADSPIDALPLPRSFPTGRVILTAGRWDSSEGYKGADELIRAMAVLSATFPDLYLVIVGGGDLAPLESLAASLGVTGRVHFLGRLAAEELAACYARAEIFALPSTAEGFGLVYLEAMAFAKPVVAAACAGTTDVIEHESNGLLVPPRDLERLSQALDRLLRDATLRADLGRRGAEIVRRQYRFDAFESALERILHDCGLDSPNSA